MGFGMFVSRVQLSERGLFGAAYRGLSSVDSACGLNLEHRDQPLLVLGVDPGDHLDVLLQPGAAQLLGQQLVDLEDAGAVGHLDLHPDRAVAPRRRS